MIDLTPLFQAIITVLAAIITCKVIPWLKAKLTNEQQTALTATCRILVYAAEQIYGSGHGDQKMQYVVDALAERGFKVDKDLIEATVKEMDFWTQESC